MATVVVAMGVLVTGFLVTGTVMAVHRASVAIEFVLLSSSLFKRTGFYIWPYIFITLLYFRYPDIIPSMLS